MQDTPESGPRGPGDGLSRVVAELADAHGVLTTYRDWRGIDVPVPRSTVVAVLAALGVDASSEPAARTALAQHERDRWRDMVPPSIVVRAGSPPAVPLRVLEPAPQIRAWVRTEDGSRRDDVVVDDERLEAVEVDGVAHTERRLRLPGDLPVGYHRLHVRVGEVERRGVEREGSEATSATGKVERRGVERGGSEATSAPGVVEVSAFLAVTPARLGLPDAVGAERVWGFMTQLYSLRSRRSWGLGDLGDLAQLVTMAGSALGAGMVLVNPLHAAAPAAPMEPSPYFPSSRLFTNPVYLRVEDVPEVADLPQQDQERVGALAAALRARNTSADLLDRDAVWQAKRAALSLAFNQPRSPEREASFDAYKRRAGESLLDFATWCALVEQHGQDWRAWPAALRDPRSAEVAAERDRLAARVGFWCWLQFLADEQLAAVQGAAVDAGMAVGVVHDLAVGVSPDGADAWAFSDVLAGGVTAGAPPDGFNQQGQDWRQPPWHPVRLARAEYAPYRQMLRSVLAHAGGLRVDHVMGLFRLWWVPEGSTPVDGTYVRYDHEALVGILALEAQRHGGLVIGEDLGTVDASSRAYLSDRGLLGTSVLWFERDEQGRPLPPERWREMCLATVTTHDLPPTAGYLDGEHVRVRADLSLLTRSVDEERAADAAYRAAWLAELRRLGLLGDRHTDAEAVAALHAFLAHTPARLLGVSLADVVGERRAQNQPGTVDEYPNWRLPLTDGSGRTVLLDDLLGTEQARALAGAVTHPFRGGSGTGPPGEA